MKQEKNNFPPAAEPSLAPLAERPSPTPPPAARPSFEKRWQRKRYWVGAALVFFLFTIIFIIPVGHLPGLRHLAWMMGFSVQDTQTISFAKALLTWVGDGERITAARAETAGALSVFDRKVQEGFQAGGPRSGLFDLAAVNASRRARGLRADGLSGAYAALDGEEGPAAMTRRVNGWSQEARQADAAKNRTEVYFGQDADVMARTAAENRRTRGSSDTIALLPKAQVAGSVPFNWFGEAVEKATMQNLSGLDDSLGQKSRTGSTALSRSGGNLSAGQKAQQDLARVWLMSSASERAKQLMLKKQLALAGYISMEMPKKVFDSMGMGSGVRLQGDEMVGQFEDANRRLLNDEQCRKLGESANVTVSDKLEKSRELIRQVRATVPKSCGAVQEWRGSLTSVQANCKEVGDTFSNMSTACGVQLKSKGRCETTYLNSYADDLDAACEALAAAEAADPPDEEALKEAQDLLKRTIKGFDEKQLNNTFNIGVDKLPAGDNDFFPVMEGSTGWLNPG